MNETQPTNSIEAAAYFHSLGLDTLPLPAGTKRISIPGWQHADPAAVWTASIEPGNVAIRCGGARNITVVDCDDKNHPRTTETVLAYLSSLGLSEGAYPRVLTPSGGSHCYLSLDHPADGSLRKLSPSIGAGELRYGSGAYVVAPPSEVQGNPYQLQSGSFEEIPTVTWPDLAGLLPTQSIIPTTHPRVTPNLLPYQSHMAGTPRRVLAMFLGRERSRYPSGSEFDQALLTLWCNLAPDLKYEELLREFLARARCGRFFDLLQVSEEQADQYLRRSFRAAQEFTDGDSPQRVELWQMIQAAENEAGGGIGGLRRKVVLLAHLSIAHAAGKREYSASIRQLSIASGQTTDLVVKETHNLIDSGHLILTRRGEAVHPNRYSIGITPSTLTHSGGVVPSMESQERYLTLAAHNLFAPSALGLSGVELYWRLLRAPANVRELAEISGLSKGTTSRVLGKLAALEAPDRLTGEFVPLVAFDGHCWGANGGLDLRGALGQYIARLEADRIENQHRRVPKLEDRLERMEDRYARQRAQFRRNSGRWKKSSK